MSGDTRPSVLREHKRADKDPGWASATVSIGLVVRRNDCRIMVNGSESRRATRPAGRSPLKSCRGRKILCSRLCSLFYECMSRGNNGGVYRHRAEGPNWSPRTQIFSVVYHEIQTANRIADDGVAGISVLSAEICCSRRHFGLADRAQYSSTANHHQ